jgi:hypothetical protein
MRTSAKEVGGNPGQRVNLDRSAEIMKGLNRLALEGKNDSGNPHQPSGFHWVSPFLSGA